MVMRISNCRPVQPFVQTYNMAVKMIPYPISRSASMEFFDAVDLASVTLGDTPTHIRWVDVYLDGFRLFNSTLDFDQSYQAYELSGRELTFKTPVTGQLQIFSYNPWEFVMPEANYIRVNNVQGAKTKARNPGDLFTGTFCEPLILTLPQNGFVRLTDDHQDLVYVPNSNFEGYDAFSYSVITERGQLADPKCVYVKIGNPSVETV